MFGQIKHKSRDRQADLQLCNWICSSCCGKWDSHVPPHQCQHPFHQILVLLLSKLNSHSVKSYQTEPKSSSSFFFLWLFGGWMLNLFPSSSLCNVSLELLGYMYIYIGNLVVSIRSTIWHVLSGWTLTAVIKSFLASLQVFLHECQSWFSKILFCKLCPFIVFFGIWQWTRIFNLKILRVKCFQLFINAMFCMKAHIFKFVLWIMYFCSVFTI